MEHLADSHTFGFHKLFGKRKKARPTDELAKRGNLKIPFSLADYYKNKPKRWPFLCKKQERNVDIKMRRAVLKIIYNSIRIF